MTPSARLLTELRDNGASFLEYGQAIATAHRDYFLAMAPDAEMLRRQQQLAAESLVAAAQLEVADDSSFSEYLEAFMRHV